MAYMGDACIVTGTYKDDQGNDRPRFMRIGAWFESDKGELSVKLEALPIPSPNPKTGDVECWVKLFVKKEDNQAPPQQQQPPARQQAQQAPPPPPQQQRRSRY
jgi:hypothetical protein